MARHSFCAYDCTLLNTEAGALCSIASNEEIGVSHQTHLGLTSPVLSTSKDRVKAKFARHEYLSALDTMIVQDDWIGEGNFVDAEVWICA